MRCEHTDCEWGIIFMPGDPKHLQRRLRDWFKALAKEDLTAASHHYAQAMEVRLGRIAIQDQKSRWGSCAASGDFVFVGGEGFQDFVLLFFRHLEEVQRPSEFRRDLIEFRRGDIEVAMGLLKAERRSTWLGGRELEGAARNFADPQRAHELEARQPSQVLGVPFPQLRVLGLLADDGVLNDGIAEVIHHRCDGEDAAQPLVQSFLLRFHVIRFRQYSHRGGGQRQPCDHASSCDRSRNSLLHDQFPLLKGNW